MSQDVMKEHEHEPEQRLHRAKTPEEKLSNSTRKTHSEGLRQKLPKIMKKNL